MREKLGDQAKSSSEITQSLTRLGYIAPSVEASQTTRAINNGDVRQMLRAKLDAEKKLDALVESVAERRKKLNGSALTS
jgi:hypothetical protein